MKKNLIIIPFRVQLFFKGIEFEGIKIKTMKDTNKKIKCAIYGNRNTAKYLIKKRHFFGKTAYYVYKKNWYGKFKLIMDANNDGILKTLEEAKEWINKMEFTDYTSEKHYY